MARNGGARGAHFRPPANVSSKLWQQLQSEASRLLSLGLVRGRGVSLDSIGQFSEIGFDLSRNLISVDASRLLNELAVARRAPGFWSDMKAGSVVNASEARQATHMSWRDPKTENRDGSKLTAIVDRFGPASRVGPQVTDVVNVGIGGSELGPALLDSVARPEAKTGRRFHSLSGLSSSAVNEVLGGLDLSRTLVVIASKSFSTVETLRLGRVLQSAYLDRGHSNWQSKFFAVTAQPTKAIEWGIAQDHVLDMGESVGGRFSVASPVALSFALTYGSGALDEFRKGLYVMDEAVADEPASSLPMRHALLSYWYRVFFGLQTWAVVPYMQTWRGLGPYLQQLCMESLGKSYTVSGKPVTTPVGSVIISEAGSNSQHSFMQYLQMGTTAVPVDLIAPLRSTTETPFAAEFDDFQLTNALAQSQTLALGGANSHPGEIDHLLEPDRRAPGGRPSNLLITPSDDLFSLGQIISFYEHSVVFQAALYDVNPFDQWGVEAGKSLARDLDGRFPRVSLQVALEFLRNSIAGRFGS